MKLKIKDRIKGPSLTLVSSVDTMLILESLSVSDL
jgi:hypothetical protein